MENTDNLGCGCSSNSDYLRPLHILQLSAQGKAHTQRYILFLL